jgi:hypothetical protein
VEGDSGDDQAHADEVGRVGEHRRGDDESARHGGYRGNEHRGARKAITVYTSFDRYGYESTGGLTCQDRYER